MGHPLPELELPFRNDGNMVNNIGNVLDIDVLRHMGVYLRDNSRIESVSPEWNDHADAESQFPFHALWYAIGKSAFEG